MFAASSKESMFAFWSVKTACTTSADKAEVGHDVEETLRRRGGRPPIGSAAASVESVRLEPELREALAERAARDHETTSSVIRKALRKYLQVG